MNNWYLSFVVCKFSGDEQDEHISTDFSWGSRMVESQDMVPDLIFIFCFILVDFRLKYCNHIMLFRMYRTFVLRGTAHF